MESQLVTGNLVDIHRREIYPAALRIRGGRIVSIHKIPEAGSHYLMPGFVDAHVHIESSMLVPAEFARLAVVHGTVATVSDPHEIANVCGVAGVRYMIDNASKTPFKFFFGAPSCVPATSFETAGATVDSQAVAALLRDPDIYYLAEMMNYPGTISREPEVMKKIEAAIAAGKPVDGHAPGLRGEALREYALAGISTDHESFTLMEAREKLALGIKCLIREGSAARNFEALIDILAMYPEETMFCSDDKHPDELLLHHINNHVRRAVAKGFNLFHVLRAACLNP
ncbi:MAG: adenine deaminase, partial [Sphingobacteriales bacterium]